MATYVFVPGGGWGGFVWRPVASLLRAAGYEVFTPTLTGLGERVHLASPQINLDTHIQDILGVLEYEDLYDVILVGHSYAGMVITGVAERAPDRLAHLVYLDAVVPQDGQTDLELLAPSFAAELVEKARNDGDGWRIPPSPDDPGKMTAHPLNSLTQPLSVKNPAAVQLPRTFIFCTDPGLESIRPSAAKARAEGWRYRELATGHMAMLRMPKELTDLLLELI